MTVTDGVEDVLEGVSPSDAMDVTEGAATSVDEVLSMSEPMLVATLSATGEFIQVDGALTKLTALVTLLWPRLSSSKLIIFGGTRFLRRSLCAPDCDAFVWSPVHIMHKFESPSLHQGGKGSARQASVLYASISMTPDLLKST